jgi:hypothetical protein
MEQAHQRAQLHDPHGAHVAVGQQRFGTVFVDDGGETLDTAKGAYSALGRHPSCRIYDRMPVQ